MRPAEGIQTHREAGEPEFIEPLRETLKRGEDQVESTEINKRIILGQETPEDLGRADELWESGKSKRPDIQYVPDAFEKLIEGLPDTIEKYKKPGPGMLAGGTTGAVLLAETGPGAAFGAVGGAVIGGLDKNMEHAFWKEAGNAYQEFARMKDADGKAVNTTVAKVAAVAFGTFAAGWEIADIFLLASKMPGAKQVLQEIGRGQLKKFLFHPGMKKSLTEFAKEHAEGFAKGEMKSLAPKAVRFFIREAAKLMNPGSSTAPLRTEIGPFSGTG
jgi:hypothetical protein